MNLELYNQTFVKVFGIPVEHLGEGFTNNAIKGWDSLAQMALISELEDRFNILLDTSDILDLDSYEKGIEILRRKGLEI